LPAITFGERSDVCTECRRSALAGGVAPGTTSTAAAPSGTPMRVSRLAIMRLMPVTTVLIGLNVAVFLAMTATGISPIEPAAGAVLEWGANWGPLSLGTQPWRMLASNYIHFGIVHILLNMWCLWNLGFLAERIFDRWTYVLVYTACGLGGSLASLWWHPMVVGAGASGAIFGLAGALIAALYLGHLPIPKEAIRGTLKSLLMFAGYNLFFGAVGGGIDNSAHIGGLVTGLALGAILAGHLMSAPDVRRQFVIFTFAGTAIVLLAAGRFVMKTNGYVAVVPRAEDALQKGHPQEVIDDLEKIAAQQPKYTPGLVLLGDAYLQEKDYAAAEKVLTQAAALDPESPEIEQMMGEAYSGEGKKPEAQAAFQKAGELRKAQRGR